MDISYSVPLYKIKKASITANLLILEGISKDACPFPDTLDETPQPEYDHPARIRTAIEELTT